MMPKRTVSEGGTGRGDAQSVLGSRIVTLAASPAAATPAPSAPAAPLRAFDFARHTDARFSEDLRDGIQTLSAAQTRPQLQAARMDLAELYLAHLMLPEGRSVLNAVSKGDLDAAGKARWGALAAGFTLMGGKALAQDAAVYDLGWQRRGAGSGGDRFRWVEGMGANTGGGVGNHSGAWDLVVNAQGGIQGGLAGWGEEEKVGMGGGGDKVGGAVGEGGAVGGGPGVGHRRKQGGPGGEAQGGARGAARPAGDVAAAIQGGALRAAVGPHGAQHR